MDPHDPDAFLLAELGEIQAADAANVVSIGALY
jgi:hypothetical protein